MDQVKVEETDDELDDKNEPTMGSTDVVIIGVQEHEAERSERSLFGAGYLPIID